MDAPQACGQEREGNERGSVMRGGDQIPELTERQKVTFGVYLGAAIVGVLWLCSLAVDVTGPGALGACAGLR